MSAAKPPKVKTFPLAKQRRLDELLEKNSSGTITERERTTLESLVAEAEKLMVANAQRLAEFARQQSPRPPVNAVPVTVWVNPQPTET